MPGAHGGSQLPLFFLTIMESVLDAIHARYAPVDARVAEILENIRRDCRALERESRNQGNERQVEEFIDRLRAEFGERMVTERQRLSAWAVRTTRWNYLFTVPGDSTDRIVLVAHYDTGRGRQHDRRGDRQAVPPRRPACRATARVDPHLLPRRLRGVRPGRTQLSAAADARRRRRSGDRDPLVHDGATDTDVDR